MVELRWLQRLGPPVAAVATVTLIASVVAAATVVPRRDCRGAPTTVARAAAPSTAEGVADATWFRIDPLLDPAGTLRGERLAIGRGSTEQPAVDLPPESFATGPFGDVVVVGSDDGTSSKVRAVVGATCWRDIGTTSDIVRSALLSPDGGTLYEHRIDRATRVDLGVWARPIAGGRATRVLDGIVPDERYGRTFSTELAWTAEGDALVVQSCGISSCRTRLLDLAARSVRTLGDANQGVLVGVAAGKLFTYASCRGLPCPVVATDIATGEVSTVATAAGAARVVDTPDGPVIAVEAIVDGAIQLQVVEPGTGATRAMPVDVPGLRLVGTTPLARGGRGIPPGWALLAPDGRPAVAGRSVLLNVLDGSTVVLPEVRR